MKEYKVVSPSLGFRNRVEKLEDILNNHAREGWIVKDLSVAEGGYIIIFERDKNR
jgi:hypothetical protein